VQAGPETRESPPEKKFTQKRTRPYTACVLGKNGTKETGFTKDRGRPRGGSGLRVWDFAFEDKQQGELVRCQGESKGKVNSQRVKTKRNRVSTKKGSLKIMGGGYSWGKIEAKFPAGGKKQTWPTSAVVIPRKSSHKR